MHQETILHQDRRFVFIHIPKTAGTSFVSLLMSLVPPEQLLWTEAPGMLPLKLVRSSKYFFGHMISDDLDVVEEPRFITSFFRDPVDRFLSAVDFYRGHADDAYLPAPIRIAKALTVREYLHDDNLDILKFLGNMASYHLGATLGDGRNWFRDPSTLARAHTNLERLDFMGLAENYQEDLGTLLDALGLRPPILPALRENVTPNRKLFWSPANERGGRNSHDETIDEELIETIKGHLAWDYEIFRIVHDRFMARNPSGYRHSLLTGPNCRRLQRDGQDVSVNNPDIEGWPVHGPYITLPHGRYKASFRYLMQPPSNDLAERFAQAELTFDICSGAGTVSHATHAVPAARVQTSVEHAETLEFALGGPVSGMEFRCKASPGVAVEIAAEVHINRVSF